MVQNPELAVEARRLVKTYRARGGDKRALTGVDLEIPVGSIFGLLGPNGAGKSTFINVLAGLVVKDSGTVRIWGFDQDVNPRMSRAMIGVVPQELNINPFFTPLETLEVQAGLYAVPKRRRRSMEILEAMDLGEQANAYARNLSGGMRRRLLVAKAMVHDPPVLVLDEPTAGVDVELRVKLWQYIRELNSAGTTVILTTHYLEEAQSMCDTIAILHHGDVVACDSTEAMLRRVDAKTLVVTPTTALREVPEALRAALPRARLTLRVDGAIVLRYSPGEIPTERALTAFQTAGVAIKDISTEEPSLLDAFLAITRQYAAVGVRHEG